MRCIHSRDNAVLSESKTKRRVYYANSGFHTKQNLRNPASCPEILCISFSGAAKRAILIMMKRRGALEDNEDLGESVSAQKRGEPRSR